MDGKDIKDRIVKSIQIKSFGFKLTHGIKDSFHVSGEWTNSDEEPLTEEIIEHLLNEKIHLMIFNPKFPNEEISGKIFPIT